MRTLKQRWRYAGSYQDSNGVTWYQFDPEAPWMRETFEPCHIVAAAFWRLDPNYCELTGMDCVG